MLYIGSIWRGEDARGNTFRPPGVLIPEHTGHVGRGRAPINGAPTEVCWVQGAGKMFSGAGGRDYVGCQIWTVLSSLAEASSLPSGDQATDRILAVCWG